MFAIPREQALRPGQYRSLMRRALARVVPDEILNRTRKAFSVRRPTLGLQSAAPEIRELFAQPCSRELGWVNVVEFLRRLGDLIEGRNDGVIPVRKTITLEMWLHSLARRGMLVRISRPLGTLHAGREHRLKGVA